MGGAGGIEVPTAGAVVSKYDHSSQVRPSAQVCGGISEFAPVPFRNLVLNCKDFATKNSWLFCSLFFRQRAWKKIGNLNKRDSKNTWTNFRTESSRASRHPWTPSGVDEPKAISRYSSFTFSTSFRDHFEGDGRFVKKKHLGQLSLGSNSQRRKI